MLSENASFKALSVKDIVTASDGTRKVGCLFCQPLSAAYAQVIFSSRKFLDVD